MSRLKGGRGDPHALYSLSFLSYREGILGVLNSCSSHVSSKDREDREDRESKAQSSPGLGYLNFTEHIFKPIKRLKFIGSWFPERSANFYSVLSRESDRTQGRIQDFF